MLRKRNAKHKGRGDKMVFPELHKLMAYKNMTLKDLAWVMGITPQATSKKITGQTEFKRSEMQKVKNHFKDLFPDITMDKIFEVNIFLP